MQAKNCRERILNLKQWRIDNALTVDECIERCGDYPSEWTIRKVFAKGSEDKATFKESTIASVEKALLGKVYEPEIKIPIEDVTRTLEDAVKPLADENRLLRRTVEQQAEIIRTLVHVGLLCVFFFSGIALYDFVSHSTGFWNTDSSGVWVAKVVFIIVVALLLIERVYALHKLKAKFESEEQAAAEVGL